MEVTHGDHPNDSGQIHVVKVGVIMAEICADESYPPEEIIKEFSKPHPAGQGHHWSQRKEACLCAETPSRVHYTLTVTENRRPKPTSPE